MRKIKLTQGKCAIVDDADYEWLISWNWYVQQRSHTKSYYAARNVRLPNGKRYQILMARQILGLNRGDPLQADHIHHNTLDNRRSELRIVTQQENQWNRARPKGYCWHKLTKKYAAYIRVNGKGIHLGLFDNANAAHDAYLSAKKQYHHIG